MNEPRFPGPDSSCACTEGVFLLRRCGQPGTALCSLCRMPICPRHQNPHEDGVVCPLCYSHEAGDGGSRFGRTSDPSASSSGVGAASGLGDWSEDGGDSPFSAEDYAAFDAISDFDKNEPNDGYDS